MYKVIKYFTDLHDNNFAYDVGDIFPHEGVEVAETRIAELASSNNKQGEPLIELIEEAPKKKATPKKEEKPAEK